LSPDAVTMLAKCSLFCALTVRGAVVLLVATALSACTQDNDSKSARKKTIRDKSHLVEVEAVERSTLSQQRTYTGSLRARRVVRIHALEEGRIISLPYWEGDAVKLGESILALDDKLLSTQLAKAVAVRRESQANLARLRRLANQRMVAKDELLRSETAVDVAKAEESLLRTRVGYTRVVAPFDGVITDRLVEPGDILQRHDHALTLADPGSLVADLKVSELVMPHLNLGDAAQVRIDALGDTSFAGTIERIHPSLDPATRLGRVEVRLNAAPAAVRAGQFARVSFQVRALDRKLVPFSAVRRDVEGEYVFRVDDKDKATLVRMRAGSRLANRVEVLEGLDEGDRIITKGFLGLNSGMKVKVVRASNAARARADGNAATAQGSAATATKPELNGALKSDKMGDKKQ
jgi:RND family efflux transporter MFP subunit